VLLGVVGIFSHSDATAYDLQYTNISDSNLSVVWHEPNDNLTPINLVGCLHCDDAACGCGSACDAGYDFSCDDGCDSLGNKKSLFGFGLIKPGEKCFDDFISPMSNPVFFEDPRNLTEVRFIFLNHNLPTALGGNSVQVYAAQVRVALTERLSLIATKDGFIYTQSDVLYSGFADVAAGLKYNLYRDPSAGRLLSAGFTYEIPMGTEQSLQGNGDGELNFFVTGGTRIGNRSHWLSAGGLRQPLDEAAENAVWYWSNHYDYRISDRPIYAFTEINWWHWASSGNMGALPEGGDLFNLGGSGLTGNNIVSQAVGLKCKPRRNIEAGLAYEFPLTERQGVLEDRLTADLIFRY
jgi:hypothetical protein